MLKSIHYNSPVVLTFSLFCSAVFIINYLTGNFLNSILALSPTFELSSLRWYFSLFLYVTAHGSTAHLMGNMTFILLLGPILEERYGSKNLLVMMGFTALVTAILNNLFFNTGIIGASGIVFLFIILISFTNMKKGKIPLTFILILILYVGNEVIKIFDNDNVSQFGHILGGLCGGLFGWYFGAREKKSNDDVAEYGRN